MADRALLRPKRRAGHPRGIQPAGELSTCPPRPTPPVTSLSLDVWRCPTCGRILSRMTLGRGSFIEIKCGNCNTVATREVA